jgi:hypothetical protein
LSRRTIGVAGALADAVDRALDLPDAASDRGQAVCDRHAEIVMAVCGKRDAGDGRNAAADLAEHLRIVFRRGVANRIGQIDRGGAGFNGGCDQLREEVDVAAGCIFGRELHVVHITARQADRRGGMVDGLLARDLQLYFEVQIGTGEKGVDAGTLCQIQ